MIRVQVMASLPLYGSVRILRSGGGRSGLSAFNIPSTLVRSFPHPAHDMRHKSFLDLYILVYLSLWSKWGPRVNRIGVVL